MSRVYYKYLGETDLNKLRDSKLEVCECAYNKYNEWLISHPTFKVHGLGRICTNDPEWLTPSMILDKAKAMYPDLTEVFTIEEFIEEAKKNQEGIDFKNC